MSVLTCCSCLACRVSPGPHSEGARAVHLVRCCAEAHEVVLLCSTAREGGSCLERVPIQNQKYCDSTLLPKPHWAEMRRSNVAMVAIQPGLTVSPMPEGWFRGIDAEAGKLLVCRCLLSGCCGLNVTDQGDCKGGSGNYHTATAPAKRQR